MRYRNVSIVPGVFSLEDIYCMLLTLLGWGLWGLLPDAEPECRGRVGAVVSPGFSVHRHRVGLLTSFSAGAALDCKIKISPKSF